MKGQPVVSVVVPAYNEEAVLAECHRRLSEVMRSTKTDYEILFVDDGSVDSTPALLKAFASRDKRVRAVVLSRNFGHQAALSAGIDFARGDAVVTMDADLQDPPELIPDLIARWREGAAVVQTRRTRRLGDGFLKKATGFLHYRMIRGVASVPLGVDEGDFRLLDRKVCDVLRGMPERDRYLRGLVAWAGFPRATVAYVRQARSAGRSHYRLSRMARLALDGLVSFSFAPLRGACALGLAGFIAGLGLLVFDMVRRSSSAGSREPWLLVIAVLLLCTGVVLAAIGAMGEYVGRIYQEVKNRPLYVVRETHGRAH